MKRVEFFHADTPQPQGSSSAYKRGEHIVVTSANKKLKPFRLRLAAAARTALSDQPLPIFAKHEPVRVTLEYTLARPRSVPKHRVYPVVKPDLDKLVRSLDALTGIVWQDDAQVVTFERVTKRYGAVPGVRIIAEAE